MINSLLLAYSGLCPHKVKRLLNFTYVIDLLVSDDVAFVRAPMQDLSAFRPKTCGKTQLCNFGGTRGSDETKRRVNFD